MKTIEISVKVKVPEVKDCAYCMFYHYNLGQHRCELFKNENIRNWKPCPACLKAREEMKGAN